MIVVEDENTDSSPKKKPNKMWDKADANSSQPLVKRSNNFLHDQSQTDQQNENNQSERQAPASTSSAQGSA